jgi:hypothetical protein
MRSRATFVSIACALPVIAAVGIVGSSEVYSVVADARLAIRKIPNQPDSPENVLRSLAIGEQVDVVGCKDYKSDIAVEVRVNDSEIGFVSNGAYRLKRGRSRDYVFTDPSRLTWSCRGLFDNRKIG